MSKLTACKFLILFMLLPLKSAYAWTISASFEGATLGSKAEGVEGFSGADGYSVITDEQILKGKCAKIAIKKGETGYGNWGGEFRFPQKVQRGGTVWYLVHTYMPKSFDHHSYGEGNRLKFMRIQTLDASGVNIGYDDLYFDTLGETNPLKAIYEGGGFWTNVGGPNDFPVKDVWESYEISVTFDTVPVSSGGKAMMRVWKNGILLTEIKNMITLRDANATADRALLFTYWNGGAPADMYMYVDEITITTDTPTMKDQFGNPYIGGFYAKRPKVVPGPVIN